MAYRIRFTKGDLAGREFALSEKTTILGRSHTCGIVIPTPEVSRQHVAIEIAGSDVYLINLSTHSTSVGLKAIPTNNRVALQPQIPVALRDKAEFELLVDGSSVPQKTVLPQPAGATRLPSPGDKTKIKNSAPSGESQTAHAPKPASTPDLNETQFLQTQLVSPEEIAKLIAGGAKKRGRRLFLKVAVFIGLFLTVAASYYIVQLRQRPETRLKWPVTASGKHDIQVVDLPTPFGRDAFWAECPGSLQFAVRTNVENKVEISTRIGSKRDVNFKATFLCIQKEANLHRNRKQLFEEWLRNCEERDGWNIQTVAPLAFLGKRGGLPYIDVQYLRTVKQHGETLRLFGYALFAVHGDCVLIMMREIPAVEQWRGASILAAQKILHIDGDEIDRHWEGRPDARDAPVQDLKDEASGLLARKSPILWQETEFLIQSALIKCGGRGENAERLLGMLKELRSNKRHTYDQYKVAWYQAKRLKDKASCQRILENALKVFSAPDDRRNWLLKKGEW